MNDPFYIGRHLLFIAHSNNVIKKIPVYILNKYKVVYER